MSTPTQSWDAGLYDDRHAFVWKHGASLVEWLAPRAGDRILDLGCGTGHLTARIAEAGAAVVGLDHSPDMLDQARAAYPGLEFVPVDARTFTFAQPFDAVFSNAVLHWVREPDAVLRRVAACLRPGGRFVAELGGRGNVAAVVAALRRAGERMGVVFEEPWYFPSIADYSTRLEAAGLEVVQALLFDRPTPLEGPDGLRAWVRMFARAALESVPEDRREEFLRLVEDAARPALFQDGTWSADYRRLRVQAVRLSS